MCLYCNTEKPKLIYNEMFTMGGISWVYDMGKATLNPMLCINNTYIPIKACPMCGIELKPIEKK